MEVLLIANRPQLGDNAGTILHHIDAFEKFSEHNVSLFNPITEIDKEVDLSKFDAIVVHYTLVLCMNYFVPIWLRGELKRYKGIKVLFIQDEYRFINKTTSAMVYIGFDIIFTNFSQEDIYKIYPKSLFPFTKFVTNHTGYVSDDDILKSSVGYDDRDIDVFYRARALPAWYGSLGRAKYLVAEKFTKHVEDMSLDFTIDISCREEDRLYGNEWINRLRRSKCVLGSETAGSVMDFTGNIQKKVEKAQKNNPSLTFNELEKKYFYGLDYLINFGQISPRHFEAVSSGCLMLLVEGNYSGIFKTWEHYVPIKRDYSNLDKVVESIRDRDLWERITSNAYSDILQSHDNNYRGLIRRFDRELHSISESHVSIFERVTSSILICNSTSTGERIFAPVKKMSLIFYFAYLLSHIFYSLFSIGGGKLALGIRKIVKLSSNIISKVKKIISIGGGKLALGIRKIVKLSSNIISKVKKIISLLIIKNKSTKLTRHIIATEMIWRTVRESNISLKEQSYIIFTYFFGKYRNSCLCLHSVNKNQRENEGQQSLFSSCSQYRKEYKKEPILDKTDCLRCRWTFFTNCE